MIVTIDTDTLDVNGLNRLYLIMPHGPEYEESERVYQLYLAALEKARCPRCQRLFAEGERYHEVSGRKLHDECYHAHMEEIDERHRHTNTSELEGRDDRRAKVLAGRRRSAIR